VAETLRATFPWMGDAMAYAKAHVAAGVIVVDDDGRIWRVKVRLASGAWKDVTPRRAENVGGKGYLRLNLHVPGVGLAIVMAHRLVYELKVRPIPEGLEIDHVDRNKSNNRPSNLEPVTGTENQRRAHANLDRTKPWAIKRASGAAEWRAGRRMLSETDRDRARAMRAEGSPLNDIAKTIGIGVSHAHRITSKEVAK